MTRLKVSEVLIDGAKLELEKLDFSNPEIAQLFEETKGKQEEIKKLKEVDEEQLKIVVQL